MSIAIRGREINRLEALSYEAAMWWRHYLIMALVGVVSVVMALAGIGLAIGAPGWI